MRYAAKPLRPGEGGTRHKLRRGDCCLSGARGLLAAGEAVRTDAPASRVAAPDYSSPTPRIAGESITRPPLRTSPLRRPDRCIEAKPRSYFRKSTLNWCEDWSLSPRSKRKHLPAHALFVFQT